MICISNVVTYYDFKNERNEDGLFYKCPKCEYKVDFAHGSILKTPYRESQHERVENDDKSDEAFLKPLEDHYNKYGHYPPMSLEERVTSDMSLIYSTCTICNERIKNEQGNFTRDSGQTRPIKGVSF